MHSLLILNWLLLLFIVFLFRRLEKQQNNKIRKIENRISKLDAVVWDLKYSMNQEYDHLRKDLQAEYDVDIKGIKVYLEILDEQISNLQNQFKKLDAELYSLKETT